MGPILPSGEPGQDRPGPINMRGYLNHVYEGVYRVSYGVDDPAHFVPVCQKCGRFVKADPVIRISEENGPQEPNATCKKCGRVAMFFEGYY